MDYIAVSSDLMFRSKIREAAGGTQVQFVKSAETLATALGSAQEKIVLVDLNCTGIDVDKTVRGIVAAQGVSRCICYCSHVDESRMQIAKEAGATEVIPRSKFVNILPSLFAHPERGAGTITLLFFGSILFAALYYAYHVLPFYYYFYELQNHMESVIKVADTETDAEIRKRLKSTIKSLQLPVDPDRLLIDRRDRRMRIQLKYREIFSIKWQDTYYDIQTFDFDAHAEGTF